MPKFRLDKTIAIVERLQSTTDAGGTKSGRKTTGTRKKGYFVPQSENAVDQGFGKFGEVFKFECNAPFDVQNSDRLIINSLQYEVKATERFTGITLDRIKCILVRSSSE